MKTATEMALGALTAACVVGVVLAVLLLASSCTDATRAHFSQFNEPADVVCYSGGVVVYHGRSTGKVTSNADEDGLYFKDAGTGKFVRVYADCIVKSL